MHSALIVLAFIFLVLTFIALSTILAMVGMVVVT